MKKLKAYAKFVIVWTLWASWFRPIVRLPLMALATGGLVMVCYEGSSTFIRIAGACLFMSISIFFGANVPKHEPRLHENVGEVFSPGI